MNDIKKKTIFKGVGVLVGLLVVFYLSTFVVPKALVTLSKASDSQKVSIKDSFLLGSTVGAKADGKDECIVSVFVLDNQGKGILGKQVQLSGLGSLNVTTDATGRAIFKLTSKEVGQYELKASVNGVALGKTVVVTFR